jgi:hypothetical protein
MSDDILHKMRSLRLRAELLNETLIDDYRPFLNEHDQCTFFRLPSNPAKTIDDVGVTATCTAMMALAHANKLDKFYDAKKTEDIDKVLTTVLNQLVSNCDWTTARLEQNNAFTTSLVLRATATLEDRRRITSTALDKKRRTKMHERSFDTATSKWIDGLSIDKSSARHISKNNVRQICLKMLKDLPDGLKVQNYDPTAAIGYWLLDSARMLRVPFTIDAAKKLVNWAVPLFWRQVSLVTANHAVLIDPIEMAMSACLCRSMSRIAQEDDVLREAMKGSDATDNELLCAVRLFFSKQNAAGVWERYFPLFHYPFAGADHCWHFEVLEAVVFEFPELLTDTSILDRLNGSLNWLESNRLTYVHNGRVFKGWNAGGDLRALRSGEPESWPIGVAHMCLSRLRLGLSAAIRGSVLDKYRDRVTVFRVKSQKSWDKYLDSSLDSLPEKYDSVKKLMGVEVLTHTEQAITSQGMPDTLGPPDRPGVLSPEFHLKDRRSALLFGPPERRKHP